MLDKGKFEDALQDMDGDIQDDGIAKFKNELSQEVGNISSVNYNQLGIAERVIKHTLVKNAVLQQTQQMLLNEGFLSSLSSVDESMQSSLFGLYESLDASMDYYSVSEIQEFQRLMGGFVNLTQQSWVKNYVAGDAGDNRAPFAKLFNPNQIVDDQKEMSEDGNHQAGIVRFFTSLTYQQSSLQGVIKLDAMRDAISALQNPGFKDEDMMKSPEMRNLWESLQEGDEQQDLVSMEKEMAEMVV